jgi:hypothetical protein
MRPYIHINGRIARKLNPKLNNCRIKLKTKSEKFKIVESLRENL